MSLYLLILQETSGELKGLVLGVRLWKRIPSEGCSALGLWTQPPRETQGQAGEMGASSECKVAPFWRRALGKQKDPNNRKKAGYSYSEGDKDSESRGSVTSRGDPAEQQMSPSVWTGGEGLPRTGGILEGRAGEGVWEEAWEVRE